MISFATPLIILKLICSSVSFPTSEHLNSWLISKYCFPSTEFSIVATFTFSNISSLSIWNCWKKLKDLRSVSVWFFNCYLNKIKIWNINKKKKKSMLLHFLQKLFFKKKIPQVKFKQFKPFIHAQIWCWAPTQIQNIQKPNTQKVLRKKKRLIDISRAIFPLLSLWFCFFIFVLKKIRKSEVYMYEYSFVFVFVVLDPIFLYLWEMKKKFIHRKNACSLFAVVCCCLRLFAVVCLPVVCS